MDGRLAWVVACGLACGLAGCQTSKESLPPKESPATALEAARRSRTPSLLADVLPTPRDDKKPRKFLPSTCVTFGNYLERLAGEKGRSPAEKDQLLEDARKSYQKAIELDPTHLPAHLSLACLYETRNDHAKTLETFQKALKVQPKNAELWYALGMCHARHKEWEPAVANMRRAIELDPENRGLLKGLGMCLARAGQPDEGLAVLKKAMTEPEAHVTLARMLHHTGQGEAAQGQLRQALALDPQLAGAQKLLAEWQGVVPAAATAPASPDGQPAAAGVVPAFSAGTP